MRAPRLSAITPGGFAPKRTVVFVGEGYDTGYGAISGYILNTMMSALYVVIILRHGHLYDFSLVVAWSKMTGFWERTGGVIQAARIQK